VALAPDYSMAYLTLGGLCMDQERMQEALHYYRLYLKHEQSAQAADMLAEVKAVVEGLQEELKG